MFEQNLLKVSVDGEMVKSNELFSEELSMTELKVLLYVCVMIYNVQLRGVKIYDFWFKFVGVVGNGEEMYECKKKMERKALAGFEPAISCLLDRRYNR